jgi:hypothetical protein
MASLSRHIAVSGQRRDKPDTRRSLHKRRVFIWLGFIGEGARSDVSRSYSHSADLFIFALNVQNSTKIVARLA